MAENLEERGFGQKEMGFVQVEHPFKETVRMFATNYAAVAGFVVLVIVILVSFLGPLSIPLTPGKWCGHRSVHQGRKDFFWEQII
ncbi:MAG: hypothetical protein Ct9H300mP19_19060 [Dehalococcoidia bacterium]|nr:MAG: hypothetical protein Ct9H300mP19_19060 [Dehalococcoidia bacterium]